VAAESPGVCQAEGMRIYNGKTGDEILPIRGYHNGREGPYGLFPGPVLFRLVTLLFHQEWWDHIWYGVFGFVAFYCWRELVVSKCFGP
jgi:hypothetical protein